LGGSDGKSAYHSVSQKEVTMALFEPCCLVLRY
jgi:hypothetical protein